MDLHNLVALGLDCWWAHSGLCQLQKGKALIPWQGAGRTMRILVQQLRSLNFIADMLDLTSVYHKNIHLLNYCEFVFSVVVLTEYSFPLSLCIIFAKHVSLIWHCINIFQNIFTLCHIARVYYESCQYSVVFSQELHSQAVKRQWYGLFFPLRFLADSIHVCSLLTAPVILQTSLMPRQ